MVTYHAGQRAHSHMHPDMLQARWSCNQPRQPTCQLVLHQGARQVARDKEGQAGPRGGRRRHNGGAFERACHKGLVRLVSRQYTGGPSVRDNSNSMCACLSHTHVFVAASARSPNRYPAASVSTDAGNSSTVAAA